MSKFAKYITEIITFRRIDYEKAWRECLSRAGIANLYNYWAWGEY